MRGRHSCVLFVAPVVCLTACTDPGLDAGTDSDARDPSATVDEIVIPMRPVEEGILFGVAVLDDADAVPRARIDTTLALAVGDGYPTHFSATLPQPLYATCGMLEGELTVHELSGGTDAISAERTDTGVALAVDTEGTADFSLTAEITLTEPSGCDLPVGTLVALDVHVAVTAVQPVATAFSRPPGCDADAPLVAPSAIAGFSVAMLDRTGAALHVANAAPDAQVALRLLGSFAAAHSEPASLAEWIAPSMPGEVEIVPALGVPLRVDVVDAEAITGIDVEFQLAGAKGPVPLEAGATYGEAGWSLDNNRIAPRVHELRVGDVALCSAPDPSWFRLESLTPAICEVVAWGPSDAKIESWAFDGASTGQAARLTQDGTCSLALKAPAFAPDAGLPALLSATFHNVGDLRDW
jgi:hypothetical protein